MNKILLLHGWNYTNYTKLTNSKDAWDNRKEFVDQLSKSFEVYKLNFPGFCGEPEPNKPWHLKDYVDYVFDYLRKNKLEVDYILGYSFGGAVATLYNVMKDPNQKIILISPAIARTNVKPRTSEPSKIRMFFRDLYLKYIVKNKYMVNGTKFLNSSYQNIVRIELIKELNMIKPDLLTVIYGDKDEMVDPYKVYDRLDDEHKKKVVFIKDGKHDIANTHTNELISIISK